VTIWSEFHPSVSTRLPQMAVNIIKPCSSFKHAVVCMYVPIRSLPLKSDSYSRGKEISAYNTKFSIPYSQKSSLNRTERELHEVLTFHNIV
jgi:hypothetical protein